MPTHTRRTLSIALDHARLAVALDTPAPPRRSNNTPINQGTTQDVRATLRAYAQSVQLIGEAMAELRDEMMEDEFAEEDRREEADRSRETEADAEVDGEAGISISRADQLERLEHIYETYVQRMRVLSSVCGGYPGVEYEAQSQEHNSIGGMGKYMAAQPVAVGGEGER